MAQQALLIDDSKSARIVLGRLLNKHGFDNVETAESGEQALGMLKDMAPDAIFVDYFMEGMDGLQTITEIKRDARFRNTPIVMCTANVGEKYQEEAVTAGAIGLLTKPPTAESLMAIIQLIEKKQAEAVAIAAEPVKEETTEPVVEAPQTPVVASGVSEAQVAAIVRDVLSQDSGMRDIISTVAGSLIEQRVQNMPASQPKVDLDALRDEVMNQVKAVIEAQVKQTAERMVKSVIEANVNPMLQRMLESINNQVKGMKDEILGQVPKKNEMIEHIKVVTEGMMEVQIREISTQVARDAANSVATEVAEQIVSDHMQDKESRPAPTNPAGLTPIKIMVGGVLILFAGAVIGIAAHFLGLLS